MFWKVGMVRIIALLVIPIFIVGCSTFGERGSRFYLQGKYDNAAHQWNQDTSNPISQYGLGLLWYYGYGSTDRNIAEASQWYLKAAKQGHSAAMNNLAVIQYENGYKKEAHSWWRLSARWGNQTAITNLKQHGYPVPEPDLYRQRKNAYQQQQKRQGEKAELMLMLMNSFMEGYNNSAVSYPNALIPTPPPNGKNQISGRCVTDNQCGYGNACIKPMGSVYGTCMEKIDEYGLRTLSPPESGVEIRNFGTEQCRLRSDCPTGFTCDHTLKVCVKS